MSDTEARIKEYRAKIEELETAKAHYHDKWLNARENIGDMNQENATLRAQVAQLESKLAQSTNYVADHETFPTCVWFANGRRVSVNAAGVLEIGFGNQLEACDERQPV